MMCEKFCFKAPSRCLVVGASGVGKTCFMQRVLRERDALFEPVPQKIYYCYRYPQSFFAAFRHVVDFITFIPDESVLSASEPSIVIMDDILADPQNVKKASELFIRGSHHLNASLFLISQNLFPNNSDFRTIALNANVYVLMYSPRKYQVARFGRDLFGKDKGKDFEHAYHISTAPAYGYLIVSLQGREQHPLRTNIFPSDAYETVFVL